ncbi:3'-5' exonuclease [Hyphobacterium sp.]|uniref:3'-5' exonuclease n=1 Tax=Hyphobacterium sp. TaxID=2004662 RepID=UPI003BAACD4B
MIQRFALSFLVFIGLAAPAAAQFAWPTEAPENWALAIVDVETTGLDPAYNEMIDLGAIYTDLDGNEIGRFFIRMNPDHPDRASEGARGVNGYDEARWQELGAVSEEEAVAAFLAFHEDMSGERTIIFTAYNAYFDRSFLDALLQEHGSSFRDLYTYYVLDLPSVAWGHGLRHLRSSGNAVAIGLEPETDDPLLHTGETGSQFNLELYRAILAAQAETAN